VWPSLAAYVVVALAFQTAAQAGRRPGRPDRHGSRAAPWQHLADRIEALDGELSVVASTDESVLRAVVILGRTDAATAAP
jgi:hypothetical protein